VAPDISKDQDCVAFIFKGNQSHPRRFKSYANMLVVSRSTYLRRQIQNKVQVVGMSQGETDAGKDSPVQWMLPT
jgi:hypothetical protein